MATDEQNKLALETRIRDDSVTEQDIAKGGNVRWVFPTFGWGNNGRGRLGALPEQLPPFNRYTFFKRRDVTLLGTPFYEGMWADALNIAITKIAGWDWEIESSIALRRKRTQNLILQSSAGVFNGWVPFLSAHLRSFCLTGKAFIEIERETTAYSSRIKALHHLNPLRCQITDDPKVPVLYYDRNGGVHELKYYQVLLFADQADATLGEYAQVESAAERAYSRITLLSAISKYLYEKVTGSRPTELNFLQGVTPQTLTDAVTATNIQASNQGTELYMGVAVQTIAGDVAIQKVTIPLAGLPDNFEPQELRDDAYLVYANALGLDPNDIDPRLGAGQALGTGAQSYILAQKAEGRGLVSWKKQFLHNINFWVTDEATTFAFNEKSPDDDLKTAQIDQTEINNITSMVEKGIITAEQGKNMLVDKGVLPREFLEQDVTGGGVLDDEDKQTEQKKPETAVPIPATEAQLEPQATTATDQDEEARKRAISKQEQERPLTNRATKAILEAQTAVNVLSAIDEGHKGNSVTCIQDEESGITTIANAEALLRKV